VDWIHLTEDSDKCEHNNELSSFVKNVRSFTDILKDYFMGFDIIFVFGVGTRISLTTEKVVVTETLQIVFPY
jgi:hypothetical protein